MIKRHLWDKVLCPRGLCDLYCNFGRRVIRSVFRWRRGLDFCDTTKTSKVRHLQAGHDRSCQTLQHAGLLWGSLDFECLSQKQVSCTVKLGDRFWMILILEGWTPNLGGFETFCGTVGSCPIYIGKNNCRNSSWWEAPKDEVGYQPKFKL